MNMKKPKGLDFIDANNLSDLLSHVITNYGKLESCTKKLLDALSHGASLENMLEYFEDFQRYREEHRLDMGELECRMKELNDIIYAEPKEPEGKK